MGIFFGTDGIRGVMNEDLTCELATTCGNALARMKPRGTILVGRDTRLSGSCLTSALAVGAMKAGANIIDVGIIPTAGIAYLTKKYKASWGVVISASHNPAQFNGIKVFDSEGKKITEDVENAIEKLFASSQVVSAADIGSFIYKPSLSKEYTQSLVYAISHKLEGMRIVLDASNGASYKIAPYIFRTLGATVYTTSCKNNGAKINDNCGALYIDALRKQVLAHHADLGFAYDGDADRLQIIGPDGSLYDGDHIVYMLTCMYIQKRWLKARTVVGTSQTNSAFVQALRKKHVSFLRTDVGDKYVMEAMDQHHLQIGGEQSGHVILSDFATTGDGILASLFVASFVKTSKKSLKELLAFSLFPQAHRNILVQDKLRVVNNEVLAQRIEQFHKQIPQGRILVRASGTEPKVRIMVECKDQTTAENIADALALCVKQL